MGLIQGLKNKIHHFREHSFVRNVAILQVGSFGSSVVSGLAGIIIARILQPQLFGVYSLAFGLASLLVLIVGLGIQDAVTTMLGKTYAQDDVSGTRDVILFLAKMTVGIACLSVVAVIVAPILSSHFYHNSQIGFYAGLLVIASLISLTWFTFSTLALQVSGKIKQMSLLVFTDQLTRSTCAILLALTGFSIAGAIYGNLIGAAIVFFISLFVWGRLHIAQPIFPGISEFKGFLKVPVRKYLRFSFWVALDKNIATLYAILPILMVGLYVSTVEVTYFKISFAYVNLALTFMGPISTLLAVHFPRMQASGSGGLRANFLKVSLYALLMSSVLTVAAIAVSPIALRILYGESFLPGLKYVFGLFIYGAFLGIGVGLGPMWRAINKVHVSILINTIVLLVGIPSGLYMISHWGIWGALIMVTCWFTISHVISFFYLLSHLE